MDKVHIKARLELKCREVNEWEKEETRETIYEFWRK